MCEFDVAVPDLFWVNEISSCLFFPFSFDRVFSFVGNATNVMESKDDATTSSVIDFLMIPLPSINRAQSSTAPFLFPRFFFSKSLFSMGCLRYAGSAQYFSMIDWLCRFFFSSFPLLFVSVTRICSFSGLQQPISLARAQQLSTIQLSAM